MSTPARKHNKFLMQITKIVIASALACAAAALQIDRRDVLRLFGSTPLRISLAAASAPIVSPLAASAKPPPLESTLQYITSDSGLKWAELREGAGASPRPGSVVTIDYMMTRRGGAKIYSTKQSGLPFSWKLGDGSVIEGLEIALLGSGGGMPPLKVGGARRVIVPQALGYGRDKGFFSSGAPTEVLNLGPIPPEFIWSDAATDKVNSYLRWRDLYQNADRLDQPDLILDIVLRSVGEPEPPRDAPTASDPAAATAAAAAPEAAPQALAPVGPAATTETTPSLRSYCDEQLGPTTIPSLRAYCDGLVDPTGAASTKATS